jgi:hypothetical protein
MLKYLALKYVEIAFWMISKMKYKFIVHIWQDLYNTCHTTDMDLRYHGIRYHH